MDEQQQIRDSAVEAASKSLNKPRGVGRQQRARAERGEAMPDWLRQDAHLLDGKTGLYNFNCEHEVATGGNGSLIGRRVSAQFDDGKYYSGTVTSCRLPTEEDEEGPLYFIQYDDGDAEEKSLDEVQKILFPDREQPRTYETVECFRGKVTAINDIEMARKRGRTNGQEQTWQSATVTVRWDLDLELELDDDDDDDDEEAEQEQEVVLLPGNYGNGTDGHGGWEVVDC